MLYAEVAVNAPAGRSTYSYAVPETLSVREGQPVWVPFGPRTVRGIIVRLGAVPGHESPRAILSASSEFNLTAFQIGIAHWTAERYLSPLFSALSLFLPPGVERQPDTYLAPSGKEDIPGGLSERQRKLLQLVASRGRIALKDVEKAMGKRRTSHDVAILVQRGLLRREDVTRERRIGERTDLLVSLSQRVREAGNDLTSVVPRTAFRQREVLEYLLSLSGPVSFEDLRVRFGTQRAVLRVLERKGLIDVHERRIWRSPLRAASPRSSIVPRLTGFQARAWKTLADGMRSGLYREYLLFGVTGSGKTELYLRATQEALASGRSAICLVPEIVLAAQTVDRFMGRFPGRVALLHSGLAPGEQLDEWERVCRGDASVVIGPRSALFAPVNNPGVIILDEEHEWAYKQDDVAPRYHARAVAREMASRARIPLLLGSATPDVETFDRALQGGAQLLELPERISDGGLPLIELVDMRNELRAGNFSLFSRVLLSAMREALGRKEQILLFLNRRGTATLVQCRRCGHVFACPR
ncbi:MAG TPA: primosomal protein N', partial [Dehalococcoidia bacterium]|nr:primosomal protein N' [Dehalococcoidia bacterium]